MTFFGYLFQAHMWREYVRVFDGYKITNGITKEWLEQIGKVSRAYCLRRARIAVYLARRLNRRKLSQC